MAVLINGKNYDWGNIVFVLFGIPVVGITEINYSRKKTSTNQYGAGQEPVSYGDGNYEYTADISLYVDEINNILNAAPNRSILDIPPSTITIMGAGPGVPGFTHKIKNVRFTEDNFSSKQGDTNIVVKCPLAIAGIEK